MTLFGEIGLTPLVRDYIDRRLNTMLTDWYADLLAHWMPDDVVQPEPFLETWLRQRYEVVERLQPKRITEIGVRAGYSAFAMLSAAPTAKYLGIDLRLTTGGGRAGAHEHAEKLLARFPDVTLIHADSQAMATLPPADLIHIDGDHSAEGCTSDLDLALESGIRWALVDDTDLLPAVREAVQTFANGRDIEWYHDGKRGSALLELR